MLWKPLYHPSIQDGYLISQYGDIRNKDTDESNSYKASYHSSNGYDYAMFMNKHMRPQLFPIDEILATVYLPIPDELINKPITVRHINGNNRDNDLSNLEWIEDVEEWRMLCDPDIRRDLYMVSSKGRIKNISNDTIMSGFENRGYQTITLKSSYDENHYVQRNVNRLVALTFVDGSSASRCVVNHIDGIKNNNKRKNLEWTTYSENSMHSYLSGLSKRHIGEQSPSAKITEDVAKKIWLLLIDDPTALNGRPETKGSPKKVMEYMIDSEPSVTCAIVGNIKRDRSWGNIVLDKDHVFKDARLTEDVVKKIWLLLIDDPVALNGRPETKGSPKKVMKYMIDEGFSVPLSKIYAIKTGVSWRSIIDNLPKGDLHNMRYVIDESTAKKIWLLLIDDPVALNGRPETKGSPRKVMKYMIDEGSNVTEGIVDSIKRGKAWTTVTGLKSNRS